MCSGMTAEGLALTVDALRCLATTGRSKERFAAHGGDLTCAQYWRRRVSWSPHWPPGWPWAIPPAYVPGAREGVVPAVAGGPVGLDHFR